MEKSDNSNVRGGETNIMTSLETSYPTATSSLNRMNHMFKAPKGDRNNRGQNANADNSAIARNSSGPITDITGITTIKSSTSNGESPNGKPITPTTVEKLESEVQRPASVRTRESITEYAGNGKSLLSACNGKESNHDDTGAMVNVSEQKHHHHQQQQQLQPHQQQTSNEVTHEFCSTGNGSRQKKVARNLLLRSALEQRTRNLTLSEKYKFNSKTDANIQNGVDVGAETDLNCIESKDCNGVNGDICNSIKKFDGNDLGVDMNGELCKVEKEEQNKPEESLNHDNSKAVTTGTTTAIPTAIATATATPPQQHIRPSTLATENGFPSAATSPAAKSTPKTPNSTPLRNDPLQSNCNNRKQQQYTSPEVPRTASAKTTTSAGTVPLKLTPKTPPVTPDSPATYLDDDLDSIYSFATTTSGRSTMSCEHSYVAHNGTTFSGRKNKFVIHNSQYAGLVGSAYVTPTQRAQNQIRKLKALLHAMQQDLNQKNDEILRLTREVAELRLFKASLNSPEERSASSDAVTVREAELQTSQDVSPIVDMVDDAIKSSPRHLASSGGSAHSHGYHNYLQQQQSVMQLSSEMQSSFADSGHFEDMTSMSVHSKDSYAANTQDGDDDDDEVGNGARASDAANAVAAAEREVEVQRQELIRMYEQRIEELIRNQDAASNEMKRLHNDKIEALLQKLSECNTRYADIVPDYEMAKERIRELEGQLENLQRKLFDQEDKQNKMYLHMYQKGQEAERIARADQALELAHRAPNNCVSINELLHQLQSTQDELENIRAAECRNECGSNHALLTAKEAISLWVLGARKTIYRRLLEAQKNRTHVDPEVTLQFLKSAVYYFLTDKENSQGHLQAIESILEFTEAEKQNISKARAAK